MFCDDRLRHRVVHLRFNKARSDAIGRDILRSAFLRKGLCKADDGAFCRGIVCLTDVSVRRYGCDIHDSAIVFIPHDRNDVLAHMVDSVKVEVDHGIPLFLCHLVEHGILCDSGIVYQNMYCAKIGLNICHRFFYGSKTRYIALICFCLHAVLRSAFIADFLSGEAIACINHRNICAKGSQLICNRFAYSAGRAGYYSYFSSY
ncbi:hypothetical protein SDC9_175843 [bioreactor metagenome]|uniref:Uncharacterized protein n=1 Tax=bioreactor metagenome TaxID=1076179 RepID=A0A645GR48_9ZZZZ